MDTSPYHSVHGIPDCLEEFLRSVDTSSARCSSLDLHILGLCPSEIASGCLRALDTAPEAKIRWNALDALRLLAPYAQEEMKQSLPVLLKALNDEASKVRWRTVEALSETAVPASEIIPSLVPALGDSFHWVRWHTYQILKRMDSREEILQCLERELLEQGNTDRRYRLLCELLETPWTTSSHLTPVFLRLLSSDCSAQVRSAAAYALEGALPAREAERGLACALSDRCGEVRAAAARALRKSVTPLPFTLEALVRSLGDAHKDVQKNAALALGTCRSYTPRVIDLLASCLEHDDTMLEGWHIFVDYLGKNEHETENVLAQCDRTRLRRVLAEDVAQGIFPTVGLKIWNSDLPFRFPSTIHPYPWREGKVYHCWTNHDELLSAKKNGEITQASFHSDWIEDVHLIAFAHLLTSPPYQWHGESPPFLIEGKGIAPLIQGGGHLRVLEGMRALPQPALTDRIDFLFASDLRMLQELMFAGLAYRVPAERRNELDYSGASAWLLFKDGFRSILSSLGLREFSQQQWFTLPGWRSNHYQRRYEREYSDLRSGLQHFFSVVRDSRAVDDVHHLIDPLLDSIETTIVNHKLSFYPPALGHFLKEEGITDIIFAPYVPSYITQQEVSI